MTSLKLLSVTFLLLFCGAAQAQFNLNRIFDAGKDVVKATTGISEEEEIKIGGELAGRMLGQVALVDDANVQAYVNRVGRWVASQGERPDLPWKFGVANAPQINAMAMPGGTILITRGLYDLLENEAQLAGVLGHEIAHVVKKHHINVMQNQSWISAGANLASAGRGGNNQLQKVALDFFKNLFINGLDKGAEYDADATGAILATRAGYNAFGLVEVLHKLNARSKGDENTALLFKTHPSPAERIDNLGKLLAPRLSQLPAGLEPELTGAAAVAAPRPSRAPASKPAPSRVSTPAVGARAFASEAPATEAAPAEAPAPAAKPAPSGSPLDVLQGIKGLFGR